ncbi:copper oxidase, partial [bacterium]|nr:copper oxidase [bacterium]
AESSLSNSMISGMLVIGLVFGLLGTPLLIRKFKGKSASEIQTYFLDLFMLVGKGVVQVVSWVIGFVSAQIRKFSTP